MELQLFEAESMSKNEGGGGGLRYLDSIFCHTTISLTQFLWLILFILSYTNKDVVVYGKNANIYLSGI